MKKNDDYYIQELEKIDENYLEMSENEIINKLDQLSKKASDDGIIEWKAFIQSEKLHYQGKYADSLAYTLSAISMSPHNYYFLSSLATTYYFMEEYDQAITCYTEAIKANRNFYRAYIDRASVYRRIRKYSMAIDDANYVIKQATDSKILATAKHSLARSYILSGNLEDAKEILLDLKDELNNSSEYFEALAALYESSGDYDSALKYYKHAKSICMDPILTTLLDTKIRIYEKKETLNPVQEMLTKLSICSEEDTNLIKILYEHSEQQTLLKEKYKKTYVSSKRKRDDWMKKNYLLCLKGWSSSTPAFSLGRGINGKQFSGGGLFIRWEEKGIVIDPGINFMENFHKLNLYAHDINYVIVTHNHIDHYCDLNKIIDLDYQFDLKIKYYLDEITYNECIKHFESFSSHNKVYKTTISDENKTFTKEILKNKITIMAFRTEHNCVGSFGIKLKLGGKDNFVLSYTSDTAFFKELPEFLDGSQIIIANFSETNHTDLFLQEYKTDHLGLYGCHTILDELKDKPDIFFLSEFWGGLGDIRIEISKRLKSLQKGNIVIVPSDIGMICTLPDMKLCCSSCKDYYHANDIQILKPMQSSQNPILQYLCKKCIQVLTNSAT